MAATGNKKTATTKPAATKRGTKTAKTKPASDTAPSATTGTAKAKPEKGPGVIASIVEFLTAATAKKPLTKQDLLDQLMKRFPDRTDTAMKRTINCQVPSRLWSDKEIEVKKNSKGYWISR